MGLPFEKWRPPGNFDIFYVDSNLFFDVVYDDYDLERLFKAYRGQMTVDELLDGLYSIGKRSTMQHFEFNKPSESMKYITLREYLSAHMREKKIDKLLKD